MNKVDKQSYTLRLKYIEGFNEFFPFHYEWYRDFEVSDSITLEDLNSIIQSILQWDGSCLYKFEVKGITYAYFRHSIEYSLLVIDDYPDEKYLHCTLPFKYLKKKKKDYLLYFFDFVDRHLFELTVLDSQIVSNNKMLSILLSYKGENIVQYPYPDTDGQIHITMDESILSKKLPETIQYYRINKEYKYIVSFIHNKDEKILEKWRKSNDKSKWQKAVTILEANNLGFEEISSKIEKSITTIRRWINAFNWYGLESIEKGRKKRDESKQHKIIAERTKRLIEIVHHKPNFYGENRSNWSIDVLAKVYNENFHLALTFCFAIKILLLLFFCLHKIPITRI